MDMHGQENLQEYDSRSPNDNMYGMEEDPDQYTIKPNKHFTDPITPQIQIPSQTLGHTVEASMDEYETHKKNRNVHVSDIYSEPNIMSN